MSVGGDGDRRESCFIPVNVHEGGIRRVVDFVTRFEVSSASEGHGAKVYDGTGLILDDDPPSVLMAKIMGIVCEILRNFLASGTILDGHCSGTGRGSGDADRDAVTDIDG